MFHGILCCVVSVRYCHFSPQQVSLDTQRAIPATFVFLALSVAGQFTASHVMMLSMYPRLSYWRQVRYNAKYPTQGTAGNTKGHADDEWRSSVASRVKPKSLPGIVKSSTPSLCVNPVRWSSLQLAHAGFSQLQWVGSVCSTHPGICKWLRVSITQVELVVVSCSMQHHSNIHHAG